ncbi:hypothetical protein JOH48_000831 [Bradyrhizobium elkanii]|nr:hypothetical protein [Bradyrhizobium elkanii]MBP2426879.1 hypothetical protein [Bradyrhizobium elkanii]WLA95368.1 hypothetical protein QNJ96_19740 [Bradyrhizobium elkanii]
MPFLRAGNQAGPGRKPTQFEGTRGNFASAAIASGLAEAPPKSLIEVSDLVEAAGERNVADLHPVPLLTREQAHGVLESSLKEPLGKTRTGVLQQILHISGRDTHAFRDLLD